MVRSVGIFLIGLFTSLQAFSHSGDSAKSGSKLLSYYNIHPSNILWKRTVWRLMDFRDPRNRPFFSDGKEITTALLEASKSGKITAYKSDRFIDSISQTTLMQQLIMQQEEPLYSDEDLQYMENESAHYDQDLYSPDSEQSSFVGSDFYQMEIKEELIFDRKYSRLVRKIVALNLFIPADHPSNILGIDHPIVSFKFEEAFEQVLSNKNLSPYVFHANLGESLSTGEAFLMLKHYAPIIKINNSRGDYIIDVMPNEKAAKIKSQQLEYDLFELEYNFWMNH